MKAIGYFAYDDVKYHIVKSEDGYLVGKENGSVITFKLNNKDKEIIRNVVDGLVPGGKFVKLLPMKVNGHAYETRYCIDKNLYIFEGAGGLDLVVLNCLWNHQEPFVAFDLKMKIKDTYQRVVKIGKKAVVVVLASTFALGMASTLKSDVYKELDSIPEEIVEVDEKSADEIFTFDFDNIQIGIDENFVENEIKGVSEDNVESEGIDEQHLEEVEDDGIEFLGDDLSQQESISESE